jgi:ankyrin repeat protein
MDAVKTVVYYLDIESLINLYISSATYKNFLESKALFTLSKKFNLKASNNFDNFVEQYDKKYLTKRCFKYFHLDICLIWAAIEGNVEIVNEALKRGANKYNNAMANAAKGGHKKIVQMMLNFGADDYNRAMAYAALGGHKEIVQMMLNIGADDYNWALASAARGKHIEIVKIILHLGARRGHKEIVQMILNYPENF